MCNASNIPSGASIMESADGRNRYRQTELWRQFTGYDFSPAHAPGARSSTQGFQQCRGLHAEMEYRGGFGGSSPAASDPRGESGANAGRHPNAFNRLQARGIRYGMLHVTLIENHTLVVGILPTIDQVGRVLWDGEDFSSAAHRWREGGGTATTASALPDCQT